MERQKIVVIGLNDRALELNEELQKIVDSTICFGGGVRHYSLVNKILPLKAQWYNITVPLSGILSVMKESHKNWVVFASGDPLFFGMANTLIREFPEADVQVYPTFNSLQVLAHRLKINYGEYKTVTLTGRPWEEFDKALIHNEAKLAVLTDRKKTPGAIAQRMLDAGISHYKMYVGECMGGEKERVTQWNLDDAASESFEVPNCLLLEQTESKPVQKGIDEKQLTTLPRRPNMITKMPIRMATLAYLYLHTQKVFWDIGACSGSVSIDAKLNYPHLQVVSFEKRPECEEIIQSNIKKYRAPGITLRMGDFAELDKTDLPLPDVAFLGGYGGQMDEILDQTNSFLALNGLIGFNSVSTKSADSFINWVNSHSYTLLTNTLLTVDDHNPIRILVAQKMN
nr:precorrin-6y C5,15-methyltransferase (decarboxylating) subunit CbiE [uncultured Carboxylicivirga sp.]